MTVPFTDANEAGIVRPITIDGVDLDIAIGSLMIDPVPIAQSVDTIDGGSITYQPSMPGGANLIDRYTFSFPVSVVSGPARRALERIRARGGYHTLATWKPISAYYVIPSQVITDGVAKLILPRYRRNAAQVFAGLIFEGVTIGTDTAPFRVWLNGTELTVAYSGTTPAAGNAALASAPDASGQTTGYTPLYIGGATALDTVEIEWFPAFSCLMTDPKISYPASIAETITYQFRER